MAIVWPCPLSVDGYVAAGRAVDAPAIPGLPAVRGADVFLVGYRRWVREAGRCRRIFVPRVRCGRCRMTDALLPAFVLAGRLDVTDSVGRAIEAVASGSVGGRPAAARIAVPHTTAREWCRRFTARADALGVGSAALCAELGGSVLRPLTNAAAHAVAALAAACEFPGWAGLTRWRFAAAVSGGRLAANTISPYLVVGKRRFLPPIPENRVETGGEHGP